MKIDVVLYRADSWDSIATYGTEAPTWRGCVEDVLSWLRIEVMPYWKPSDIRLAPCAGTDTRAAIALYGIGLSWGIIDPGDHDWLRENQLEVE